MNWMRRSLLRSSNEVATKQIAHTIPFLVTIDETFDIGVDTRTPVDDKAYRVPFPFTGTINKLTIKLGPEQLPSGPVGTTGKKP
jgi:hypothetical protein